MADSVYCRLHIEFERMLSTGTLDTTGAKDGD